MRAEAEADQGSPETAQGGNGAATPASERVVLQVQGRPKSKVVPVKAILESEPPEEPLVWPEDFPPTDPVKKFFWGIRWLGPDISFYMRLREQQAARTERQLVAWTEPRERMIAQVFGECLSKALRWNTPYFIPSDSAVAVAYGSKFQSMEDFLFEDATRDFQQRHGKQFRKGFWAGNITAGINPSTKSMNWTTGSGLELTSGTASSL